MYIHNMYTLDAQRSCDPANGYVLPMSPALLPCVLDGSRGLNEVERREPPM